VTTARGDSLDHERARALVLEYGWNTTAYQILNPGFSLWFSRAHPAVAGYVCAAGRRVVGGAPVCAAEHLAEVAAELEHDASANGESVVYFGAEARLDAVYAQSRTHASLSLGAQPAWHPADWAPIIATHASLRAQLNRARNKGVRVELWPSARAQRNPSLQRCLEDWLRTRGLPPLHFLVEPETLGELTDRRVFVAIRDDAPVGFLIASPIPARNGWLTEQFVRGRGAPNGTAELMIDAAVRWMADDGADYVTLGLAPLSRRAGDDGPHSWWLRAGFAWLRAHGKRFYNFDGLDAFKAKFCPERWEPVYAIANEPAFSVASLYAIGAAFTEGHPVRTVLRGLGAAVRQEVQWMRNVP
jgi:phosphatidylglycerol lysyltransferase